MPAFGLIKRAIASNHDKARSKDTEQVLVEEPQSVTEPHTLPKRSSTVPQPSTGPGSQRRFPALRGRASSSTSLTPSLASTTATSGTRRPRLATKSSSLPSVSEPSVSHIHADSIMAKRKSSATHESRKGKGRDVERDEVRPPAAPQRSESEEALIKQLDAAGRGESMTMVTRSSGSSPVTPAAEPLPSVTGPSGTATPSSQEVTSGGQQESSRDKSKANLQERLQEAARSPRLAAAPRPALGRPVASSDSTTSRLLRMSSWLGQRNVSAASSIKEADTQNLQLGTADPVTQTSEPAPPERDEKSEVKVSEAAVAQSVTSPDGHTSEGIDKDATSNATAADGAADQPVSAPAAQRASPVPSGWMTYLAYSRRKAAVTSADASMAVNTESKPDSALVPGESVNQGEEAEISGKEDSTGEVPATAPAEVSNQAASENALPVSNDAEEPPTITIAPSPEVPPLPADQGWTGYAKSWLVPVLPSRLAPLVDPSPSGPRANATSESGTAEQMPNEGSARTSSEPDGASAAFARQRGDSVREQVSAGPEATQRVSTPATAEPSARVDKVDTPQAAPDKAKPIPISKPASAKVSRKEKVAAAEAIRQPSVVLPSFEDTFGKPPRAVKRKRPENSLPTATPDAPAAAVPGAVWKALGAVSSYVRRQAASTSRPPANEAVSSTAPDQEVDDRFQHLPRMGSKTGSGQWQGVRRVVIVGVHGWFPHKNVQRLTGAPRSSAFFASTMGEAILSQFEADHGIGEEQLEKLTYIPLDGEGSIDVRVDKLFKQYLSKPEWIADMRRADAVFFVAHSQGCIVTSHLVSRLIMQGHIRSPNNAESVKRCEWAFGPIVLPPHARAARSGSDQAVQGFQKLLFLAMCGVHQGPFYSLTMSAMLQPYLYFESLATKELFDFQDTTSTLSCDYQRSLSVLLDHSVKVLLVASLDDQMVPIYSAAFAAASHPLLLRAIFVDSRSNAADDWMTQLVVFAIKIRNAGLDDQGLLEHLSEVTAGSMRGVGHSAAYEESGPYILAIRYLLGTNLPTESAVPLQVEPFAARESKNDYELPWILRGLMDSPEIRALFQMEIDGLKEGILDWKPATKPLREIKQKLEPMAGRTALRNRASRLLKSPSSASLASSNGGVGQGGSDGKPTPVGSPLAADLKKNGAAMGESSPMRGNRGATYGSPKQP